jgi:hypothetical protein
MQFVHAYLAGSVLPREYPLRELCHRQQIKLLRNDCSAFDFPVGILCSGLRGLWMRDIGTAGFAGFMDPPDDTLYEVRYFNGGHGEPLSPYNHESIIAFILHGDLRKPDKLLPKDEARNKMAQFERFSRLAPWLIGILAIVLIALATLFIYSLVADFQMWKLVVLIGGIIFIRVASEVA